MVIGHIESYWLHKVCREKGLGVRDMQMNVDVPMCQGLNRTSQQFAIVFLVNSNPPFHPFPISRWPSVPREGGGLGHPRGIAEGSLYSWRRKLHLRAWMVALCHYRSFCMYIHPLKGGNRTQWVTDHQQYCPMLLLMWLCLICIGM